MKKKKIGVSKTWFTMMLAFLIVTPKLHGSLPPYYEVQTAMFGEPPASDHVFIQNTSGENSWSGNDPGAVKGVAINDNLNSAGVGTPPGGFYDSQGGVLVFDMLGEAGNGGFTALSSVFPAGEGGPGALGIPLNLNDVTVQVDVAFYIPGHPEITSLDNTLNFWVKEVDGDDFELESEDCLDLTNSWQTYEYELDNLPLVYPTGGVFGDSAPTLISVEFEGPDDLPGVETIIFFIDNFRLVNSGETIFFEDFEPQLDATDIYSIIMWDTEYREDGSPLESFEFSVGVSGEGITQATITPPGGSPIALSSSPSNPMFWGFDDETYDTPAALRAAYPTGNYVFTFNGGADSVTVNHNPTIPTGFANITYPANGATGVPSNPVITWDSASSYGDALHMAVAEEDAEGLLDTQFLADISQTSWAVGPLNPGILHWLEVSVLAGTGSQPYNLVTANSDNFEFYDFFENCNEVFFTTAGPVVDDDLDIERIGIMTELEYLDGSPDGPYPWDFEIDVLVSDPGELHHIDVTNPLGASVESETIYQTEPGLWGFDPPKDVSLDDLRAKYPEGIYTFEFYDSENSLLKTVSLNYSGLSSPASPVDFTYPSLNGETGVSTDATLMWNIAPEAGDILAPGIDDEETEEQVYGALVPMTTLSWSPGPLEADHDYHLDVTVSKIKDWAGPDSLPTMVVEDDEFIYYLTFDYINTIYFTTGSAAEPIDEIEVVLDFVDDSVEDGILTGDGPGNSGDNRLNALINMLEEAQGLIEAELYEEACDQLWSIYRKCDGESRPPDFVTGDAADDLADMILILMEELGCD